jgi:hypothetical protein
MITENEKYIILQIVNKIELIMFRSLLWFK